MNSQTNKLLIIILSVLSLTFCKKKDDSKNNSDSTKPVITLNGNATMEIAVGSAAIDPGATASDDTDGDITSKITSDWGSIVNSNISGNYTVTYSVSDNAGNSASVTRLVTVKFGSNSFFGEYNSTFTNSGTTSGVFTSTISAGDNVNQFVIYPFRGANIYLKVNVGGTFGNELSFSQVDFGNTTTGYGTIENFGKRINLTYTVYTSIGDFPQTETLDKK